ncbi:MAG: hypothetical protein NC343_05140 [Muribaculum sp.]|nr:hypothetical protein [Muribaculaceae bacterium]MCM1081117.1 hypothetical protein [Muribaculum sp.]
MIKCLRYWLKKPLRMWRGRGFGIHSPFAFYFVNDVVRERYAYYAYDRIDAIARDVRAENKLVQPCMLITPKGARFLFRLACCFDVRAAIMVGTTYGAGEAAICMSGSGVKVYVMPQWPGGITEAVADQISPYNGQTPERMLVVNGITSDVDKIKLIAYKVLANEGVVVVRNQHLHGYCRALANDLSKSDSRQGSYFTNGRATVFAGLRRLQPQKFEVDLPC